MIDKIKRDTEINWKKALNFIPKKDEIIIYDCENITRIKVGDGITTVNNLPFAEEEIAHISNINRIENETVIMENN